MRDTLGGIWTAAVLLAACALQSVFADGVARARLGDLRRTDMVVVDVPDYSAYGVAISNLTGIANDHTEAIADLADFANSTHDGVKDVNRNLVSFISWAKHYATNNYRSAWWANYRAGQLEQWAASVSNQLLLADAPPGSLRYSHYFTASNGLLVATINAMMRNNVRYLPDDSRVPALGVYMASGTRSVISTNDAGAVSASTYPVLTLYSDGNKVWTSDPLDSANYGWLVALVLVLVGSAGGVLWRYVAKASDMSDVGRALDDIIAGMDQDPSPGEGSGPSVPGVSDIVEPGGMEGNL